MTEAGFFQQKRGSPVGLAAVVAIHAAVLAALILIKGPDILRHINRPIHMIEIAPPRIPPPDAARPQPKQDQTTLTRPTREIELPIRNDQFVEGAATTTTTTSIAGPERIEIARVERVPVRREAEIVGRDLQPPYPAIEERAQRGGQVRLRVTIGPDGRVLAVERISATSDAFWRATERQAMSRWRFRPALVDGRPVESVKVMTVTFRIGEA